MRAALFRLAWLPLFAAQLVCATNRPAASRGFQALVAQSAGQTVSAGQFGAASPRRVAAPQAQSVQLDIGGVKYPMTKGEDGAWVGVSQPQDEGFHYYQLVIDGAGVPDPGSLYFYGASRWGSGIEVPAQDQDFYAAKNVPHGQLRQMLFYSKDADANLRCFVYTPPDYEKDPSKRYPVLYLQHGGGEDDTGWGSQGHTGLIMDNLIAEGKTRPCIIVMANSYVPGTNARSRTVPRRCRWRHQCSTATARPRRTPIRFQRFHAGAHRRPDSVHRRQLPHDGRSAASGHGRAFDGRHADPLDHAGKSGQILAHRHFQRRQHRARRYRRSGRLQAESESRIRQLRQPRERRGRQGECRRTATSGCAQRASITNHPIPGTNGRPGGGACTSSRRCCSKTARSAPDGKLRARRGYHPHQGRPGHAFQRL